MAFDKKEIFDKAMKIAAESGVHFIEDVIAELPCQKTTFYDFFPSGSEESESIKRLVENNKIATKRKIRAQLAKGEKAAELIALYKLLATEDERRALSMQAVEHSGKVNVSATQLSDDQIDALTNGKID